MSHVAGREEASGRMKLKPFHVRFVWWSVGAAVAMVGVALLANRLTVQSVEIAVVPSPDGATEAVLLNVPRDAHGAHSAKVCLRRSATPAFGQGSCTRIAYLSGLLASDRELGIDLAWQSSTELEIRYREATAAYLYYPTFVWPTAGRRTLGGARNWTPIHTRLVHSNSAENEALTK